MYMQSFSAPQFVAVIVTRNFIMAMINLTTGYRLNGRGSIPDRDTIFLFYIASRPALGSTDPHIEWVPGVKRQGGEGDYSPPSNGQMKKAGAIPPLHNTFS
jgi:hypothetical protein